MCWGISVTFEEETWSNSNEGHSRNELYSKIVFVPLSLHTKMPSFVFAVACYTVTEYCVHICFLPTTYPGTHI